jgi:multidrug efflux pump subunit AcrB
VNKIIAWFAANNVASNLLMLFIIFAGIISLPQIRKETFPSIPLDSISISIVYPGASPTEVEQSVCTRVEEAIYDIQGIDELTSNSSENLCSVNVDVQKGFNTEDLYNQIKTRIDGIVSFPQEIEKPNIVANQTRRNTVLSLILSGPADELALKKLADKLRDNILELPSITQVEEHNVKPYEVSIELTDRSLRAYNLSFTEVADAIKRASLDLGGGVIKTLGGDVLLRTEGQRRVGPQFSRIPLRAKPDGTYMTVGQVADVKDGLAESDTEGRFNGQPAVLLTVYRVGDQSVLQVSQEVKDYVKKIRNTLPKGISVNIWHDRSRMFKDRLNLLVRNAIMGLGLVFFLLVLFLRLRLAIWVSAGIIVAFMGALYVLPYFDGSINMISMFAFVLVLGIVVDDAIVVGERIFTLHRKGVYGLEASIIGTQDVAKPVIFAVLTTIIAFLPIFFLPGIEGKIWQVIAVVVIATLFFSLVESMLILPSHLSHLDSTRQSGIAFLHYLSEKQLQFVNRVEQFIFEVYRPFLSLVLRWRYVTVSFFVAVFIIFIVLVKGGWIPMVFFPKVEGDVITSSVRFAQGTNVEKTRKAVSHMEHAAQALRKELINEVGADQFNGIISSVGSQPMSRSGITGGHVGEVSIELIPAENRLVSNDKIMKRWREKIGQIPESLELGFNSSITHRGSDIDIQLTGNNLQELNRAAIALQEQLRGYSGIYDIRSSFETGKRELQLTLKPYAETIGLTYSALARQVRQAFYGEEVQRIQRNKDEVKVFVRYTESERRSVYSLENMTIKLSNGSEVPLSTVAEIKYGRSPSEIRRINRKRIIDVTAYVDSTKTKTNNVLADLKGGFLANLNKNYSDVQWHPSGSQKHKKELISSMVNGFYLSVMGIFALLAVSFRSYIQPIIVISAIPFGLIGAILGHAILGLDISLLSLSGMIAVSGVVVNDNLVLVDFINRSRDTGMEIDQAIREAGMARFRPILLTSLTTFAGLSPIMMEKSVQAQFLIPMAVSLAFGVMFATTVSLLLTPASYHILEDVKALVAKRPNHPAPGS